MLPRLPRWLLFGFVLAAGITLVLLFRSMPLDLPPDCKTAASAMEAGDHNLAIDHYFLCLEAEDLPPRVRAHVFYGLGNAYSAKGNLHQAIEDYGEALRLDPAHGWAYNNRCWNRGLLRESTEALGDCNEALKLLPDQPEVFDSRALAYWQLGEQGKARADLARAHEIDPAFPTADERFREFEKMFE
jgi:tetratricopeptide (TPR) repeat protein